MYYVCIYMGFQAVAVTATHVSSSSYGGELEQLNSYSREVKAVRLVVYICFVYI
jgi:hypothetical protein